MSLVVSFEEIFESKSGLLSGHHTWNRIELAAVAEILNGYAFKSDLFSKENGFPLIRIRDIAKNRTETYFMGTYPKEYIVRSGDLLIGMDGNFSCNEWRGKNGLLNQRVCKIIPDERYLNKRFLLFAINGYLAAIQQATSSITVGHLSSQDVLRIPFPLPPFNEQRRIVAKLERLLEKVDACKERLDKIPAILKRFRQSVLAAACSGKLTADWRHDNKQVRPSPRFESIAASATDDDSPDTWEKVRSADLFSFVTSGSRGWARYYSDDGSIFIRIGNLDHGTISLDLKSVQRVNPPTGAEGVRTRVCPNDILISITADVGMVALVPENIGEAYINQHVALARPKADLCSKYLAWYLAASEGGLKQFQEMQRGATKVGLGLNDIKNVWIPMPPIPEQHEIVRRVEALFKLADDIEKRYGKARAHIDKLTQSILAKAFRGELVPQDPNDEPASELLKRIRAEREKRETEGRAGRQGSGRRTRAGKVHPERNNSSNR